MELWCVALMGSHVDYILEFLLGLPTILRSDFFLPFLRLIRFDLYPLRVLLAGIRDLGICSCPRCLVKKDEIPRIGMKSDENIRLKKARIDSEERRGNVKKARNAIYRDGFVVNSNTVNQFLKKESLMSTEVNNTYFLDSLLLSFSISECIFHGFISMWIQLFQNACGRLDA